MFFFQAFTMENAIGPIGSMSFLKHVQPFKDIYHRVKGAHYITASVSIWNRVLVCPPQTRWRASSLSWWTLWRRKREP